MKERLDVLLVKRNLAESRENRLGVNGGGGVSIVEPESVTIKIAL